MNYEYFHEGRFQIVRWQTEHIISTLKQLHKNEFELTICKTQQPLEILVQFIKKNYGLQTVRLLLNRWFSSLISDCPKSEFRSEKVRTRKQSRE